MKVLLLGIGKTGSLVARVVRERGHELEVLRSTDNPHASSLTRARLAQFDVVMDFTRPDCVIDHIRAVVAANKNMLVGTTGWYGDLEKVRTLVEQHATGFLHGANFSLGINLVFDLLRSARLAIDLAYSPHIYERHHADKKDAPSGTAAMMKRLLEEKSPVEVEITSFREGEVVGMHELVLDSPHDTIYLCHDAKSRQGFAEGAVRAAEWLVGKRGFFDFKDIWQLVAKA